MHCTRALTQVAHGKLWSHLTLRCWHNIQASKRLDLDLAGWGEAEVVAGVSNTAGGSVDMFNTVDTMVLDRFAGRGCTRPTMRGCDT